MESPDYFSIFLKIIGSLALLIYGMKVMSEALQKMAGAQLRHILGAMTTNRFTGMLTGTFITCAVQSSSATTVMTVSFVNAGLLTLAQAISVIMGANIGTTLTAWIMSLGFSVNLIDFVFPAFIVGLVLIYTRRHRYIGDFLFGIAFMFFSLVLLSQAGNELRLDNNPELVEFFKSFDTGSYLTIIIFLLIGTAITCVVQSSAAVMAITILLCSTGVLPIYLGIALVGVVWVLVFFYPFVNMVCSLVNYDPADGHAGAQKLSMVLAMFHTAFNVCNTFILIWFIPQMEKAVCRIIKMKRRDEDEDSRLRFISSGIMQTPELSVLEARKEITLFAERIQRMFSMVRDLLETNNDADFAKLFARIEKYESISDNMEIEIAKYLDNVSNAHLSDETKAKIRVMLREISEIESIGDSCYNIARSINRKIKGKEDFTEEQYQHLHQMFSLTNDSIAQMNVIISGRKDNLDVNRSFNIENEINNYRTQLKSQNINDVNDHKYTYAIGTMYMDIVSECEKLADYVVNVVEVHMGTRQREA